LHYRFILVIQLVQHKFYVASASLIYPVILGRDILTALATASARGAERDAWKLLPKGWLLDEVVLDNNDIYIVAARPENETADESKHRFYVGINPSLVKWPSRAEQLGGLKPHPALKKADLKSSPVFTFIHLNRHLRKAFGRKSPFAQSLIAVLIEKARCFRRLVVNDVRDAYMHLWVLPSNRSLYTVNITPSTILPILMSSGAYLMDLPTRHVDANGEFQLNSFMDDLLLYSDLPRPRVEQDLRELCADYDLSLKPAKRQDITEGDARVLGLDFVNHGEMIATPQGKLDKLKQKVPCDSCSYSDLLSTLGVLEELPTTPPWVNALRHVVYYMFARVESIGYRLAQSCPGP
ncbi:hypothetical protein FOZ60_002801, partial [Perkinsus olseni]